MLESTPGGFPELDGLVVGARGDQFAIRRKRMTRVI